MAATKGLGTYGDGVGVVTPLDHKMAQLGLVVKTAANTIRPGLFWDGNPTIVTGAANMSYNVRAFSAVTSRGASQGAVLLTNDGAVNVAQDVTGASLTAPGSNSRYDVVFVWQREFTLDGTNSEPLIGVLKGTAAASPTAPSLASYPGAIELARILVPAGVTATNSGTTITETAPFTAASGGVIALRNTTERDAGSYVEGQLAWLIDSNTFQLFDGSAWKSPGDSLIAAGNLSAVSSFNIDNLTGANDYEVTLILPTSSAANDISVVLRSGGSANSTTNYDMQRDGASATTTFATSALAQSSWATLLGASRSDKTFVFRTVGLNKNERTIVQFDASAWDATANTYTLRGSLRHRTAATFDGLGFTVSTGTVTGRYEVRSL